MHPAKKGKTSEQGKTSSLLEDIRLVVEATPFDEVLEVKVGAVEKELQAIDQALADEGTYLGIVDKVRRRRPVCPVLSAWRLERCGRQHTHRLTPNFTFICFWWRHELRQL